MIIIESKRKKPETVLKQYPDAKINTIEQEPKTL